MIKVELTQDKYAIIDDEDEKLIKDNKWHAVYLKGIWYANTYIYTGGYNEGYNISMHRVIMRVSDLSVEIDHKNHNGLDNRKENLRVANRTQQLANRRKYLQNGKSSSKYKGVYWKKQTNRWCSHIQLNKKQIHIGYFSNEIEAAVAYDKKALELFGEFALINFIK